MGGLKIQYISINLWEGLSHIFKDPQWMIDTSSPPQDGDNNRIHGMGGG